MFGNMYLGAIAQSITEALPLSSSAHLHMIGITNHVPLHIATGLGGLVYITTTGLLWKFIKQSIPVLYELIGSIRQNRTEKLVLLSMLVAIVWIKQSYIDAYIRVIPSEITVVGALLSTAFLYMADLQPETGPTRIYHSHYLISALANVIALIPGTSRLGSVYAALRIVGLGRKQAFYFTTIQGILINAAATLTMLPQSLTSKTLSLATYSPYLIASALYIVLLHTLLSFLSRELHYILLGCCLYRTCIFPFLYINFA